MSLKFDINMCRICMKTNDGISIYLNNEIIKKIKFCTQLKILKTDDLPKRICNKCVGRLEVAYDFRKQAEYTNKYLRQIITHHKKDLNQSAQGKETLYYKMILQIFHTQIKLEQDYQIEQQTNFESEGVPMVNIPPTLKEGIKCEGAAQLTDRVPVDAVIGEYSLADKVDIEKIQENNQINFFKIAKVTSIPKSEAQTGEITGNGSCSQEDFKSLINDIQIKVEQGEQMTQPTDVKPVKILETIEEGIQYKGSTCGADVAKIEEIEKMQKKIFTITKVTSILNKEDDQTEKFECIVCGARFSLKPSLKRHSYLHSGERPHKCKICGRRFAQSDGLTRHSRIHLKKRPFKCNLCDRTFTQKHFLAPHLRRHLGKRPYECNFCDRSFMVTSRLASHLKRHAENPYTCEICGFSFRYRNSLKHHVFMKHETTK